MFLMKSNNFLSKLGIKNLIEIKLWRGQAFLALCMSFIFAMCVSYLLVLPDRATANPAPTPSDPAVLTVGGEMLNTTIPDGVCSVTVRAVGGGGGYYAGGGGAATVFNGGGALRIDDFGEGGGGGGSSFVMGTTLNGLGTATESLRPN